jgi:hypothetical protein
MSQHFKSKYDQMRENVSSTASKPDDNNSSDSGSIRNICFVLEDGSQQFLNYGYLISGIIDSEKIKITLSFSSHLIVIEGIQLTEMFWKIFNHRVSIVEVVDVRYESLEGNHQPKITAIKITEIT